MIMFVYGKLLVGLGVGIDNNYYPKKQNLINNNSNYAAEYIDYTVPYNSFSHENKSYKIVLKKKAKQTIYINKTHNNKSKNDDKTNNNSIANNNNQNNNSYQLLDLGLEITFNSNQGGNIDLNNILQNLIKINNNQQGGNLIKDMKKYNFIIKYSQDQKAHIDQITTQKSLTTNKNSQNTLLNIFIANSNNKSNANITNNNQDDVYVNMSIQNIIDMLKLQILKQNSLDRKMIFPFFYPEQLQDHHYYLHHGVLDIFLGINTEGSSVRMGNFYVPATKLCLYTMISIGLGGVAREITTNAKHYYQPEPVAWHFGLHTRHVGIIYVLYSSVIYHNHHKNNSFFVNLIKLSKSSSIGISLHFYKFIIYIMYNIETKTIQISLHAIHLMSNVRYTQKAIKLKKRKTKMIVQ